MNKSHFGFTLIELLVVIAIMSLLISIGVPTFAQVRIASKRAVCMANMHSIAQALEAYMSVNDDYWPNASKMVSIEDDPNLLSISQVLSREVRGVREVFRCPADRPRIESVDPNNIGKTYYESEKTSYEWDVFFGMFSGRKRGHDPVTDAAGLGWGASDVALMADFECFHGGTSRPTFDLQNPRPVVDKPRSLVVMYADLSVRTDDYQVGRH
jgi:prepilin-type N-terminal cleavage/methylation domain-containing protein